MYRIREVDSEDYAEELDWLHRGSFTDGTVVADFTDGFWWIAFEQTKYGPAGAAFVGLRQSVLAPDVGYFVRVGVLPQHRGQRLQRRLMRAIECKAKKIGWTRIVTDTRNNPHSANNIIDAGYRMFNPDDPWSFNDSAYWTKDLT